MNELHPLQHSCVQVVYCLRYKNLHIVSCFSVPLLLPSVTQV
jgi:hypothetical protein